MKATKKLLSILLILALCMSLMSVTAFADDVQAGAETPSTEENTQPTEQETEAGSSLRAAYSNVTVDTSKLVNAEGASLEDETKAEEETKADAEKATEPADEKIIVVWNQAELEKAIADADLEKGQSIEFGEPIVVHGTLVVDRPVTINFKSFSLTATPTEEEAYCAVEVLGAATLKNGTIITKSAVIGSGENATTVNYSVVLSADSSSSLKELWISAAAGQLLGGNAKEVYQVDADLDNKIVVIPEEDETEAATEAPATEAATEAPATEAATEAPATEAETEAPATEAETEAPATEAETEAPATEAETEAPATEAAPAEEPETEAATEPATEPATEKKGILETLFGGNDATEESYVPDDAVEIDTPTELEDEVQEPAVTPSPVKEEPDAVEPTELVNSSKDVTVSGTTNSFDKDVDLVTETLAPGDESYEKAVSAVEAISDAIEDVEYEVLSVVDVSFMADGEKLQPNEKMTVSVKLDNIPEDADRIAVMHINADGSAYEVRTFVNEEAGVVCFVAGEFSPFAITARRDSASRSVAAGKTAKTVKDPTVWTQDLGYASVADALQGRNGTVTIYLAKNSTENVTIPAGVNVIVVGQGKKLGNLTVNGYVTLENVTVGDITVNAGADLIVKDQKVVGGNITVNGAADPNQPMVQISTGTFKNISYSGSAGQVIGRITGGSYTSAVPADLLELGYLNSALQANGTYTPLRAVATVKSDDGKSILNYYKGAAQASRNADYSFTVSPKLIDASIAPPVWAGNIYEEIPLYSPDYNYNYERDNVTISSNADFLDNLPAGENRFSFVFEDGAMVTVPLKVWANVTYEPSQHIKGSETDVIFKPTDMPVSIVLDKETTLVSGKDYILGSNGEIVVKSDWLDALKAGNHTFDFVYSMGTDTYRLSCTVNVSAEYHITKINDVDTSKLGTKAQVDWYTNSGKTLTLRADGNPDIFAGVRVDGRAVSSSYYSAYASNGTTVVELKPAFLNTLAVGTHTASVVFTDGDASANFEVHRGSSSPKTGDENNMGLWVAVMVLSGAAVVALVPKKKKQ